MNENIHQILKDAGAAKGITADEVMMIFVLGNEDLFQSFLRQIEPILPVEEFKKVKTVFEQERINIELSQKKYEKGLGNIIAEIKTDIFTHKIEELAETNPEDLIALEKAISEL